MYLQGRLQLYFGAGVNYGAANPRRRKAHDTFNYGDRDEKSLAHSQGLLDIRKRHVARWCARPSNIWRQGCLLCPVLLGNVALEFNGY
jgi:hypothetical protein